jgi:hypothetical protein
LEGLQTAGPFAFGRSNKTKARYTRSTREQSSAVDLAEEVLRERFVSFLSDDEQNYSDIRTEVRRIDLSFSIKGERQVAELKSCKSAAN